MVMASLARSLDPHGRAQPSGPAAASGRLTSQQVFLSIMGTGRDERRLALAVVILSAIVFIPAALFARTKLIEVPAFIPFYEAALLINDLITAMLLFGQFVQVRSQAILALAAGYLFCVMITIAHVLTFPGTFGPNGVIGGGAQTTVWLYTFWHGGFPLFVLAYALLKGRETKVERRADSVRRALVSVGAVAAVVCFLTLLATSPLELLPSIMQKHVYRGSTIFVMSPIWGLSLLALVVLWRRRPHSVLDLWLMVVMCAWLFDVALSAVLNGGRFDLGFYAGRVYGLAASSFVLGVLILETSGLYGRLARATARLEDKAKQLEDDVRARISLHARTEEQLRQAQKMEAIGNLTGGMAHDFNNLLGVIIGNLDVLCGIRKSDTETTELAGEARDAALRGADLTRRLLAFARRTPLQPQLIDINQRVAEITKLLRRTLGERIEIVLNLARDVWPVVADPVQLEASLANLANNARDAMPNGGRLTIMTSNRALDADYSARYPDVAPGDYAMLEVSDTGTGMAGDVVVRIFEPFFTTKGRDKGTGLGLSMVFGYMKQSGGHINVYSEPGMGTTIRLYLPRAKQGASAEPAPIVRDDIPLGRGEIVLAVEDNAALCRIVVRQLGELGYRVLHAENAASAIAILERETVDLLFTDVVMPGEQSGIELAEIASIRWPKMRVLLTSGFPESKPMQKMGPVVARPLLSKPYRKEDLARALRKALEA